MSDEEDLIPLPDGDSLPSFDLSDLSVDQNLRQYRWISAMWWVNTLCAYCFPLETITLAYDASVKIEFVFGAVIADLRAGMPVVLILLSYTDERQFSSWCTEMNASEQKIPIYLRSQEDPVQVYPHPSLSEIHI